MKGRYFIVTGGTSGIGIETVRCLASHGAHVVRPPATAAAARAIGPSRSAVAAGGTRARCP